MLKFVLLAALVCLAHAIPVDQVIDSESKKSERSIINEIPLNVTEFGANPCETTRNFNYYVPYPKDSARYIQCDPWGTGVIKTCAEGTVWDMWALCCQEESKIQNMTLVIPERVFNCSLSGHECMNGGVCTESTLGGDRCVCKPEWTGPACETRVDTTDLTHEILNGTFSIHEFADRLTALNITVDVDQYLRYKDQLDNKTFSELMNYMNLYKGRQIRYDTLINNLVESVLENIYPDAAYLATFNASSISVVELVQLIPNLMSYSKYSLERYQDVFAKYQQVLGRLVGYMNGTHAHWRKEAEQYTKLTAIFMNQTLSLLNQTQGQTFQNSESVNALLSQQQNRSTGEGVQTQLSEEEVRESLRTQFNSTLVATQRLYIALEGFQKDVMSLVQNNTRDVYTLTLAESKLNGTSEVQTMLTQISSSSVQIWDQLVNYGFWFITSILSTPEAVAAVQAVEKTIEKTVV